MPLEGAQDNNARKLYEQFRRQLKTDEQDIFYDEDELVEIYDQAADMEDEYVKFQALLLAYRLYPKSEEMAARRGYFFWSYNMDEGVEQLLKGHLATGGLIWKILALRNRSLTNAELEAQLEDLLVNTSGIDDETMIQLVDLASEAGSFDWLKKHESLLRSKTSYLPTLLYELQIVATLQGDRNYAIAKLEELTELEPFNADYWSILSEEQLNAGNLEAALTSADYAMAIDSENSEAIIARTRAMACSDTSNHEEILHLITPLLKKKSSDSRAVKIAVTALLQLDRTKEATDILTEYIDRNPWNREVIEYLLVLRYEKINEVLTKFYESNSDNSEKYWADWASEKYTSGRFKEAAMIFGCYATFNKLSEQNLDLYVSSLYIGKFYQAVKTILTQALEDSRITGVIASSVAVVGILTLLRTEGISKTRPYLHKILRLHPQSKFISADSMIQCYGYKPLLERINKFISKIPARTAQELEDFLDAFDHLADLSDPQIDY